MVHLRLHTSNCVVTQVEFYSVMYMYIQYVYEMTQLRARYVNMTSFFFTSPKLNNALTVMALESLLLPF